MTYTAAVTGTHYIEARAYRNQTGDYTVRVTEWVDTDAERAGATDLGDITDLSGARFPNASFDGDGDRFAVTLEAGKTYQFDLEGESTDKGTLGDPYLRGIHDATGALIDGTTDDDDGDVLNSRVEFTAAASGAYYAAAGASGNLTGSSYTLAVEEVVDGI